MYRLSAAFSMLTSPTTSIAISTLASTPPISTGQDEARFNCVKDDLKQGATQEPASSTAAADAKADMEERQNPGEVGKLISQINNQIKLALESVSVPGVEKANAWKALREELEQLEETLKELGKSVSNAPINFKARLEKMISLREHHKELLDQQKGIQDMYGVENYYNDKSLMLIEDTLDTVARKLLDILPILRKGTEKDGLKDILIKLLNDSDNFLKIHCPQTSSQEETQHLKASALFEGSSVDLLAQLRATIPTATNTRQTNSQQQIQPRIASVAQITSGLDKIALAESDTPQVVRQEIDGRKGRGGRAARKEPSFRFNYDADVDSDSSI